MNPISTIPDPAVIAERIRDVKRERQLLWRLYRLAVDAQSERERPRKLSQFNGIPEIESGAKNGRTAER